MPELWDLAERRAVKMLEQVAHVKIETEDINDTVSVESGSSTGSGADSKKKVKIHVKGIKLKDEFVKNSDAKWKEVCIKNFDYIDQRINSGKAGDKSAAYFARTHDYE